MSHKQDPNEPIIRGSHSSIRLVANEFVDNELSKLLKRSLGEGSPSPNQNKEDFSRFKSFLAQDSSRFSGESHYGSGKNKKNSSLFLHHLNVPASSAEENAEMILHFKEFTGVIEGHLKDESNILGQLIRNFYQYFTQKYAKTIEEKTILPFAEFKRQTQSAIEDQRP